MIVGGYQFPIATSLRKNQQQYAMCHVQRFNQDNTCLGNRLSPSYKNILFFIPINF